MGHEGEDFGDQALLDGCFLLLLAFALSSEEGTNELRVKFGQARLSGVIEDQHGVDHVYSADRCRPARLEVFGGVVGGNFEGRRGFGEGCDEF